jgi:hypothetical protein
VAEISPDLTTNDPVKLKGNIDSAPTTFGVAQAGLI